MRHCPRCRDGLRQLVAAIDAALAGGCLGPLAKLQERNGTRAVPTHAAGGELEDAVCDGNDRANGALGQSLRAQLADELGEVVNVDGVKPPGIPTRSQVVLDVRRINLARGFA